MAAAAAGAIARRDRQFGRQMAAPALSALLLVILFPIFFALYTSAFDYTLIHPAHDDFVGLAHYRSALGDVEFGHSLWVTLRFVAAVVILEFLLGFTVALMLNTVERGKNVYYLILLLPLLINPVVVGLIWRMFLHPVLGIVNYLLGLIGIGAVNWLGDPRTRSGPSSWSTSGTRCRSWSSCCWPGFRRCRASLRSGAHGGRLGAPDLHPRPLPLMRPVIMVTLLIRLIFAVRTYDLIYIMTRGGPGQATDLVSYFIYRQAFVTLNIAQAAAMSVILLLIVLALTAYLHRYMRSLV